MSLLNKFFNKKQKSDALAKKSAPLKKISEQQEIAEKKELTLREMNEQQAPKTSAVKAKKHDTKDAYRVLIKPLVTEKGTYLHSENKYLFAVAIKANKITIKKAIWHLYGIKPLAINIVNVRGKKVRYGRTTGRTKNWKKAIITLKEGESIKVYEGV